MYLTGTYKHNLDAKSRITLPASIRKQIDDTVCLVPVDGVIYGFTPEGHEAWVQSFFPEGFNPRNKRDTKLRRMLTSMTVTVDLDSAGRLALGKLGSEKIAKCGIEREVAVVGNNDHFEIWNAATWNEKQEALTDEDLAALLYRE
jgi:MraZ protein